MLEEISLQMYGNRNSGFHDRNFLDSVCYPYGDLDFGEDETFIGKSLFGMRVVNISKDNGQQ